MENISKNLHPRNKFNKAYNIEQLAKNTPDLRKYVVQVDHDHLSIDFTQPEAVFHLNKALLKTTYGIKGWRVLPKSLVPTVPGRLNYIHYLADLLGGKTGRGVHILDIGTGSGCIAISLAKFLPKCKVYALDVSTKALEVAKQNAKNSQVEIEFINLDILQDKICATIPQKLDVIVSNPPYIPMQEMKNMELQVTAHEPNIALFVPDEDPLVFYKAIARLAKLHLSTNGQLFFEIHYDQGEATIALLDEMHFHAELREDLFGKDRMIRASLKPR